MKLLSPKHFLLLFLSISTILSCSKDEDPLLNAQVVGSWKLTELRSPIAFDINGDNIANANLLEELSCSNNEELSCDALGNVQSVYTYNYSHRIARVSANLYKHEVECGEELLAWATDYISEDQDIYFLERKSYIKGNQLFTRYESSIDIYNADYSQIIDSIDLTMVYTKIAE